MKRKSIVRSFTSLQMFHTHNASMYYSACGCRINNLTNIKTPASGVVEPDPPLRKTQRWYIILYSIGGFAVNQEIFFNLCVAATSPSRFNRWDQKAAVPLCATAALLRCHCCAAEKGTQTALWTHLLQVEAFRLGVEDVRCWDRSARSDEEQK